MHVLTEAGIVARQKRGRFVLYSLLPGVYEANPQAGTLSHLNLGCCRLELPASNDPQPND